MVSDRDPVARQPDSNPGLENQGNCHKQDTEEYILRAQVIEEI